LIYFLAVEPPPVTTTNFDTNLEKNKGLFKGFD